MPPRCPEVSPKIKNTNTNNRLIVFLYCVCYAGGFYSDLIFKSAAPVQTAVSAVPSGLFCKCALSCRGVEFQVKCSLTQRRDSFHLRCLFQIQKGALLPTGRSRRRGAGTGSCESSALTSVMRDG